MTITGFTPLADSTVEARARRGRKGQHWNLPGVLLANLPEPIWRNH